MTPAERAQWIDLLREYREDYQHECMNGNASLLDDTNSLIAYTAWATLRAVRLALERLS